MGEVVPIRRPDPADVAREAEIRELCRLGGIPDAADRYIRRRTSREEVLSNCILARFGRRLPQEAAWRLARLRGPAGTARRTRPTHPQPHGTRRRPIRET